MLKVITILWLVFMTILSHIPGGPSGEESRWLSSMTGVKESVLRRSAHVVLYLVLGVLATLAWAETELWVRILVLVIIAVADESSKALRFFKDRHSSMAEMGLNVIGAIAGLVIGWLIGLIG